MPAPGDHLGWAAHWGQQCINTIARCEARQPEEALLINLDLEHIKRSARLAWWHVCRAKGYKYWDVGYSGIPT